MEGFSNIIATLHKRPLTPLFILLILFGWVGCSDSEESESSLKAQAVVDSAILVHGGENYTRLNVEFDFRDIHYTARRDEGKFTYTRAFRDSLNNEVLDVLSNEDFYREVNGERVDLPEEREQAYSSSVNSVIYFALLPFGLNDPAVNKEYLGEVRVNEEPYHKIKVTFDEEGGGEDFEDVFIYWIHKETYNMDYLAYSFHVNGGGMRFRDGYNAREVQGVRFSDYVNYEPESTDIPLEKLDSLFENNKLVEVSKINLENIQSR